MTLLKDVRVPGFIWAIAIVITTYFINKFTPTLELYTGIDAFVWQLIIIPALIGVLKGLNLGTDQLNQALDIIDLLLKRGKTMDTPQTRGLALERPPVEVADIPKRPSKLARWLVG